jgi:hypothetical protein
LVKREKSLFPNANAPVSVADIVVVSAARLAEVVGDATTGAAVTERVVTVRRKTRLVTVRVRPMDAGRRIANIMRLVALVVLVVGRRV